MKPDCAALVSQLACHLLVLALLLFRGGAGAGHGAPSNKTGKGLGRERHLKGHVVSFHINTGIHHVQEEKMDKLYRENMDLDFELWKDKELTMQMVEDTADWLRSMYPDCYKRILIYNNSWYFADQDSMKETPLNCPEPCNGRYPDIYQPLSLAMNHSLEIPNVFFIFNICDCDQRHCQPSTLTECKVPIFQTIKYAKGDDVDTPILVPLLEQQPPISLFPWEAKSERALFRGTPFPQYGEREFEIHLRAFLANLSLHHSDLLDVGLVHPYDGGDESVPVKIPAVERVSVKDHARWRYLLALDGVSASTRLSKLMSSNSIILKSYSFWIEFYYRSLKEGKNYFSVVKKHTRDVLEVMPQVRKFVKQHPAEAEAMVLDNLDFYQTYLTMAPRFVYWREALTRYRALFPDMDAHIQQYLEKHGIVSSKKKKTGWFGW